MSLEVNMESVEGLRDFLGDIKENLVDRDILEAMAAEAKRRVLERTGGGTDVHGAAFKPYSKAYRKLREKKGLSGTRVDLKSTGEMLGDIVTGARPARGEATVSFSKGNSARKAGFHHEGRVRREFFGLDAAGREAIREMLEEHVGEVIKDAH